MTIEPSIEVLRSTGEPDDDLDPLLRLPDDLPDIVVEYARSITEGTRDDFDRAAALQEWFREEGGFIYDIESRPGHSTTALADFLTERRGYCEQFAASMAVMARVLGIPSRVAVGFTPGDYQGDSTWLVRAHDSHAWPELYFEGVGWVRFEPTPAARSGMAPDWTFVPTTSTPSGTSTSPSQPRPQPTATQPGTAPEDDLGAGGGGSDDPPASEWPLVVLAAVLVVAFVTTPYLYARLGRTWRWRHVSASDDAPVATAEAAWAELREAVRDAGLTWDPAETPRTTGQRLAVEADLDEPGQAGLSRLVTATERARYAPHAEFETSLHSDAIRVRHGILAAAPAAVRVRAFLWPSRLRDAATEANRALTAGFDWLDASGARTRAALNRRMERGLRSRS